MSPDASNIDIDSSHPIVVLGAGAVGCGLAAALAGQGGRRVVVTTSWAEHRDAINRHGLKATDDAGDSWTVDVQACLPEDLQELASPVKVAYVASKADGVRDNALLVKPLLAEDGVAVSMTNGITIDVLTDVLGSNHVVGGVPLFAARRTGPGLVLLTGTSRHLAVGEIAGGSSNRVLAIAQLVGEGPWQTHVRDNILGVLWSKLISNATVNALSVLGGWTVGQLMEPAVRDTLVEMVIEACSVAERVDVKLELLPTMDIPGMAVAAAKGDRATVARLLAAGPGSVFPSARPSSLQDFERGVPTELAWLTGYVVRLGRELGVPTPTCSLVLSTVKRLEGGEPRTDALVQSTLVSKTKSQ